LPEPSRRPFEPSAALAKLSLFAWQAGYGAFAVSYSQLGQVKTYIAKQQEHHRRKSFQEEFREFLLMSCHVDYQGLTHPGY
jgi:hypothetical protein